MKQCESHTLLVRASRRAYTAGASLLRPIVRKNNEISWKQSSNTLSTVVDKISRNSALPVKIAPATFPFDKNSQTSILLELLAVLRSDDVEQMYLFNDGMVEGNDIVGFYVGSFILFK